MYWVRTCLYHVLTYVHAFILNSLIISGMLNIVIFLKDIFSSLGVMLPRAANVATSATQSTVYVHIYVNKYYIHMCNKYLSCILNMSIYVDNLYIYSHPLLILYTYLFTSYYIHTA